MGLKGKPSQAAVGLKGSWKDTEANQEGLSLPSPPKTLSERGAWRDQRVCVYISIFTHTGIRTGC